MKSKRKKHTHTHRMLRLLMERALNSLISRNNVIYVLDASGCDDDRKCQFFFATRFFLALFTAQSKTFQIVFVAVAALNVTDTN